MPNGFSAGSASGAGASSGMGAGNSFSMTGQYQGNTYVVELQQGSAGSASSLEEWVRSDMNASGSSNSSSNSGSNSSGSSSGSTSGSSSTGGFNLAGVSSSDIVTTTVGGYQAVTILNFPLGNGQSNNGNSGNNR